MELRTELLDTSVHTRDSFINSDLSIQDFLRTRANKEHKLRISDTYVLVNNEAPNIVLGYYTLSNHSIILADIPSALAKQLPKYSTVGTVLLGRIERNHDSTPRGFGIILLKEAIKQSLKRGSFFALELHAKNEPLIKYYEKFGFISLPDNKNHMIIPYKTLESLMNG